jgi:hypothetical protein
VNEYTPDGSSANAPSWLFAKRKVTWDDKQQKLAFAE